MTGSNFYAVHTRVETTKKKPQETCDALVNRLLNPSPLHNISHVQRGAMLKPIASIKLVSKLKAKGHVNVTFRSCGLYIDSEDQFLGASPDGIVSCDCCQDRLVEIKCPSTDLAAYPHLDKDGKLKTKDPYYGQVQGQMMVTGSRQSWFFVFYEEHEGHLELIEIDETFVSLLRNNLRKLFHLYMAPQLIIGRKRKM